MLSVQLSEAEKASFNKVSDPGIRYPGWIQLYNSTGRYPEGFDYSGSNWVLGESPV